MDILPIEVVVYQSLFKIIELYYQLSIFIKNQQPEKHTSSFKGFLHPFVILFFSGMIIQFCIDTSSVNAIMAK